jgi:hypothetical protein
MMTSPIWIKDRSTIDRMITGEQRPWMKLVVEHGVDWTKQEALSSVSKTHGVEGFLGECVTAWYDSLSLLKTGEMPLCGHT